MHIQPGATTPLIAQIQAAAHTARIEGRAEKEADAAVTGAAVADGPVADGPVASEPADSEISGVLRLLQEGHFSGVADVRLRIVHAERIAALTSEQVSPDIAEPVENIISDTASTVAELAAASESVSTEQIDATIVDFGDQVTAAIETFQTVVEQDIESLETTLQAAFQSLIDQLELAPAADLDELSASFVASLTSLLTSIEPASTLPAISEPNGSGVAFEKFMAIYEQMQNNVEIADETSLIDVDV